MRIHKPIWTHFTSTDRKNVFHAFCLETCEKCNKPVEASSPINFHEPKSRLFSLGMIELNESLPELGYCESLDLVVCPDCYAD